MNVAVTRTVGEYGIHKVLLGLTAKISAMKVLGTEDTPRAYI
jgi:hypothetical protein